MDRLTFLGGLVAASVSARDASRKQPVQLPPDRPLEWKLRVLDGPDFVLSKHRGSCVFITFFATWCGPCRREQPGFVEFAQSHAGDTFVLGVDVKETDNAVRAWRREFAVTYPLAMDERGLFHTALIPPRVVPATIVVAPGGFLGSWWYGTAGRSRLEYARASALGLAPLPSPSPSSDDEDDVYTPGTQPSPSPLATPSGAP